MATRSTIALEYADGSIGQIYCHWDGYPEHNGRLLAEHWMDPFKVRDLMDLGDLSILGAEIGSKHDFDERVSGICTAYGRDRGETGVEAQVFRDFSEYCSHGRIEEFNYILRQIAGKPCWFVSTDDLGPRLTPLDQVLDSQEQA